MALKSHKFSIGRQNRFVLAPVQRLNSEILRLNQPKIKMIMLYLYFNLQPKPPPSPLLPPPDRGLILLDYGGRLVNSKHNQTLRRLSVAWNWKHTVLSSLVAKISNYLPRASVHCAGTFPFHHYIQAAPFKSQPAEAAAAAQQTVSSMHHGGNPSKLQWIPRFVWEKIHVYTNHRCCERFFFF